MRTRPQHIRRCASAKRRSGAQINPAVCSLPFSLRSTGSMGKTVKLGDVVVDTEKGTAVKNNRDLFLSALEYRLLLFFINNRGIVLTRERLLDAIWDVAGEYVNDNTLTVYIKRLREKIEDDPTDPKIILTVRGTGYKVDA